MSKVVELATDGSCKYVVNRENGEVIMLSWHEAYYIHAAYERECNRENLQTRIESAENDDGTYWIGSLKSVKLTEEGIDCLIDAALDDFEGRLDNCEEWAYHADSSLVHAMDRLREDGAANGDVCA